MDPLLIGQRHQGHRWTGGQSARSSVLHTDHGMTCSGADVSPDGSRQAPTATSAGVTGRLPLFKACWQGRLTGEARVHLGQTRRFTRRSNCCSRSKPAPTGLTGQHPAQCKRGPQIHQAEEAVFVLDGEMTVQISERTMRATGEPSCSFRVGSSTRSASPLRVAGTRRAIMVNDVDNQST
jgi:hypothetical protein